MNKRIFLDTTVCINVANGRISGDTWERAQSLIRRSYRYCISWITVKELFGKLSRGDSAHYDENKCPLRCLASGWGSPGPLYLADPPVAAISIALPEVDVPQRAKERDGSYLRTLVNLVLRAASKEEMRGGVLKKGSRHKGERFDLDSFDSSENEPQRIHAAICEGLRCGSHVFPASSREYAALTVGGLRN
jgi:hypothetical protein